MIVYARCFLLSLEQNATETNFTAPKVPIPDKFIQYILVNFFCSVIAYGKIGN